VLKQEELKVLKGIFGFRNRILRRQKMVMKDNQAMIEAYLKKPKVIEIETIAYCNASCLMCPIPSMKRKRGVMSDELFKKIINELVEIQPYQICPFNNGEPLLDKKLVSRIEYINKVLPNTSIVIYTNAALLNQEKIEELNQVRVDKINISFNAGRKESYEKIMGLDFDNVVANIDLLLKLKKNTKVLVSMIKIPQNRGEVGSFVKMWRGKDVTVKVWEPMDFGQRIQLNFKQRARRFFDFLLPPPPCVRALETMTILYDGRASLCSRDFEGEVILGDVSSESLLQVWNSERGKNIRWRQLEGSRNKIHMCKKCPGYNLPKRWGNLLGGDYENP